MSVEFHNDLVKDVCKKFDLTIWERDHLVWLNHIILKDKYKGKGFGTKIMEKYCQWLDENHFDSKLLACNCYGTPVETLIKFYSKFGFELYQEGRSKQTYMIRYCEK